MNNNLKLITKATSGILELDPPGELRIPVCGQCCLKKPGDRVQKGELVATSIYPFDANTHSPAAGLVTEVRPEAVCVTVSEDQTVEPEKTELDILFGDELNLALRGLGVPTGGLARSRAIVAVSLEQEPGISVNSAIMASDSKRPALGLKTVMDMTGAEKACLVAPKGMGHCLAGTKTIEVDPRYPAGLKPMAIKAATGEEHPYATKAFTLRELYLIGLAATIREPVTKTILSVNGKTVLAPVGMRIRDLLDKFDIQVGELDRVVLGGPMLGEAAYTLDAGITKNTTGITVVKHGDFPAFTDNQCLNCGECRLVCPARLRPDMLSRYGEFGFHEKCLDENLAHCVECGLCSYVCPAGRPVLQLIRLSVQELKAQGFNFIAW